MREFVAIEVGDPAAARDRASPHLTLLFLGEVPAERNGWLVERLDEVARGFAPFVLRIEGVGAFPSSTRPRVVWVGVSAGREEVVELARRVREAIGEPAETRELFVPHLTLFRVRSEADRRAAEELLAGRRPAPPPREVAVHELLLKESVLGAGGAVHRTLAALPLRGAAAGDA